jgi:hypothetical protein
MGNRFVVLSLLTGLFQIVCGIALIVGLVAIFGDQNTVGSPNDPLAQIPAGMRMIGGAVLALYGLTGLVFSGGINVLISTEENTYSLREQLPATIAALQKALTAIQPTGLSAPSQAAAEKPLEPPPSVPIHAGVQVAPLECPSCGFSNDGNSRFCEGCGSPLAQS